MRIVDAKSSSRRADIHRRAFTLVEMLVVIGIIVLLVAVSVPVVKTLNGNSSIAAAQNKIGTVLIASRADAIYNRQITGAFFFIDPQTNDFQIAEVMPNQVFSAAALPTSLTNQTTVATSFTPGPFYGSASLNSVPSLELVYAWQPPTVGNTLETKYYTRDIVSLPVGIGVALYNSNSLPATHVPLPSFPGQPDPTLDRYQRMGAIMFNTDGSLLQMNYGVAGYYIPNGVARGQNPANQLYNRLTQLNINSGAGTDITSKIADQALTSSVGLSVYDHNAYLAQSIPQTFTDVDLEYLLPWQAAAGNPTSALKQAEEAWIDQNGVSLMVSPFNGRIVKSK